MRGLTATIWLRVGAAALGGVAVSALLLALTDGLDGGAGLALLIAAGVSAAAAGIVARSIAGPLERLEASTRGERRFAVSGPREVESLSAALRAMAEEVEDGRRGAVAERDRLGTLLDELGEAILIADSSGRIERANRAAGTTFGPELEGRALVEVVRDHELLEAIAAARTDVDAVAQVERADPPRFQRAMARRLSDGRLLLVVQDLTAMRRLETVRRDFVANVSHELRTPLASLSAMVEALESGALREPDVAADFVRRIRHEHDGLAQLVEDLLILGRVESGQELMVIEATSPDDLLARAADRMRALVERAGVRLVVARATGLPAVAADRDRVGQVFANLLHNATRHTGPGGEIRMGATATDGAVSFEVRDSGEGIALGDLDRIFERFYKGDRSRASGGTGLGLSIARHIVEAHGGSIRAESDGPGRGATFTFTLPVARR